MIKSRKDPLNKIYILFAFASLIASWIPSIEPLYKIALLISFIILLIIIYYSKYFKISDQIRQEIKELENRLSKIEDLINIKSDIKSIKNKLNIK